MLLVALCALASACSQPAPRPDNYYRLQVAPPATPYPAPPLAGTLVVRRPIAEGLAGGRAIVYGEGEDPPVFRRYHYEHWAVAPPRMLEDLTVTYLRASHVAAAVVPTEARASADFVLDTHLYRLDQVHRAAPGMVLVDIGFTLRNGHNGRLIWTRDYRERQATPGVGVAGAVRAMERAVSRILARLVADLAHT